MEDEVDYSFLTRVEYEEALIDEQITEEVVYQADGQGGYQLRFKLVSPLKKNDVPIKQPATPAKKVVVLPKKGLSHPKHCRNQHLQPQLIKSNSNLQLMR